MRFHPFALLGLQAAQVRIPLQEPTRAASMTDQKTEFKFKEGSDVFAPKDLVSALDMFPILQY